MITYHAAPAMRCRCPAWAFPSAQEALARLSDAERQAWRTLWADVAQTLARARGPAPAQKKLDNK
jgi:hypothetical protein